MPMIHRLFGEGRQSEIEGYIAQFLDWVMEERVDGPVLDIGANYGWGLAYLNVTHGLHGVGVELNPQRVLSPSPVVLQGDAVQVMRGLPDESMGLVYLCHSLEHLPNYTDALLEAWRLLRPKGVLAVAVPHPLSMDWIAADGSHITLFTPEFLERRVYDTLGVRPTRMRPQLALRPNHEETWALWTK